MPSRDRARPAFARVALAAALALAVAGCDAEWGGASVRIVRAPEREQAPEPADTLEPGIEPIRLPDGPVLFRVWRTTDGRARAEAMLVAGTAFAEVGPAAPERWSEYARAFDSAYYAAGAELAVYRDGARVGTFRVEAPIVDSLGSCPALVAEGTIELSPAAVNVLEFVGAEEGRFPLGEGYRAPDLRPEARELAAVLAERLLRQRGWDDAWRPRQAQEVRAVWLGEGPPGFAATFLRGDSLAILPADSAAAALFLVASYDRSLGYVPVHAEYQRYAEGEKRAPRWIDRFDADGDGQLEWILLAFGSRTRWYEVYDGSGSAWRRSWSGRQPLCEATPPG